jgi:hypothetical protein
LFVQQCAIGLRLLLVLLLRRGEGAQAVVPIGFQCIGDQTILGIDLHKALLRQIGFIAGSLNALLTQAICFLQALAARPVRLPVSQVAWRRAPTD